jgi:long-chain acyl-CoA synthetase
MYRVDFMNIAQLLVRAARVFPDRVAITGGFAPHATYRELGRRAAAIAHYFCSTLRLQPGDRVALYMANCPAYLEVLAGIWWAGLTAVPVHAKLVARELAYILDDAQASCCFVVPGGIEASVAAIGESRTIDVTSARYQQIAQGDHEASIAWNVPDDLAWLCYTNGTKGVMLSHRNLMAMTLCHFADVESIEGESCVIHASPLSHGSGLYALPHLAAASANVIPEGGGVDPTEVFALARHWRNARMFATPTMVKRLVDAVRATSADIEQVKTIIYSGDPMDPPDIPDALSIMGQRFVQIYGRAECPMSITALSRFHFGDTHHPRYHARIASVGVPQSAVEVRLVDDADRPVPAGQAGEIVVRGDAVMRGYWMNAQATADALRGGWFHTGDIGVFDADGFLTLARPAHAKAHSEGSGAYPH